MPKHHYKNASCDRKCSLLRIPHLVISGLPQLSSDLQRNTELPVPSEQECRPGYNGRENSARYFSLLAVDDIYASTQKLQETASFFRRQYNSLAIQEIPRILRIPKEH